MLTPKNYIGDRQKKVVYSTVKSLALLVVRVIDDPRTLNQTVIACDGETNIDEAWAIAEKVSGEDFSDYTMVWKCIFVHSLILNVPLGSRRRYIGQNEEQ